LPNSRRSKHNSVLHWIGARGADRVMAEWDRLDGERPTAKEMLERVRREAGAGARGRLRIFLGIAPGVGKTYAC